MTNYYDTNRLAAVEILEAWGINPHDIATFGVTGEGYFEFQRDSFGAKIIVTQNEDGSTSAQVKSREWPRGFPVQTFLAAVEAMWRA